MTGIVKRCAAQGCVVRSTDPVDGRVVHVALTEAGAEQMAAWRAVYIAELKHLLGGLDADERRAIEAALPALERPLATAHMSREKEC